VNSLHSLLAEFFWPAKPVKGALNKDPTVWLDGARPVNTCIPPSFEENMPMQLQGVPRLKNTFTSIKELAKFSEIFKYLREFDKLSFGSREFV
jgi:hypothetical protein